MNPKKEIKTRDWLKEGTTSLRLDLAELLIELPPEQREIVQLRADGFNQQEIAERLKINQSSVSRILKKIQKRMHHTALTKLDNDLQEVFDNNA